MGEDWMPVAIAIATALALRLVDYLLPKGRHLPCIDKWTKKDDDEETDE